MSETKRCGGLLSGVGPYFKQLSPKTKIIAVESYVAPALHASLLAQRPITLDEIDTFADGIVVKKNGDLTFGICKTLVDDVVLVPEGKICSTILSLYNDHAMIVEHAGPISVAALDALGIDIKDKNVAIIICGGNNDINRTEEIREGALL